MSDANIFSTSAKKIEMRTKKIKFKMLNYPLLPVNESTIIPLNTH